jgi:cellulase/cellobiase CelA1
MKSGVRCVVGALAGIATLSVAEPSKADVCYELVRAINHPALHMDDCVPDIGDLEWSDSLCVVNFTCCIPIACDLNPICAGRVLIREGFTETLKCNITFEDAFDLWIRNQIFLNPDPLFPLVEQLYADGDPLPGDIVRLLNDLRESHLTNDLDWPTPLELNQIRVVRDSDSEVIHVPEGKHAVTLSDVIILTNGRYDEIYDQPAPTIEDFECDFPSLEGLRESYVDSLRTLIHEIVHTMQYRNVGAIPFYASYALSGESEDEAADIPEELYANARESTCGGTASSALVSRSGEALFGIDRVLINDRAEVRSGAWEAGRCGGEFRVFPCYGRVVTPATTDIGVRVGVEAGVGQILSGTTVDLRDRSFVEDSIETARKVIFGNDVEVLGPVYQDASAPGGFLMRNRLIPRMDPGHALEPGQRLENLPPGNYRFLKLKPGAVANLLPGNFFFGELEIDVGAAVVVTGLGPGGASRTVTRIWVNWPMMLKGAFVSDPYDTLLIQMAGGVEITGEFSATLVAQNGKVSIYRGPLGPNGYPRRRGSVYAREVELHQDTVFVQVPFGYPWIANSDDVAFEEEPEDPPPSSLTANVAVTSDWGTGYCAILNVTNAGSSSATWTAQLSTTGSTISNLWNAIVTTSAPNLVTVTPHQWNGTIAPGTTDSSVGFCADRASPGSFVTVLAVAS